MKTTLPRCNIYIVPPRHPSPSALRSALNNAANIEVPETRAHPGRTRGDTRNARASRMERLAVNLDLLSIYAYSDRVHSKDRELWRDFMSLILPLLLEVDAGEIGRILENAAARTPEDIIKEHEEIDSPEKLVRYISAALCDELDLDPELGLAAFLDCTLPTRTHAAKPQLSDGEIMGRWLARFAKAQRRDAFASVVAEWKSALEALMMDEDLIGAVDEGDATPDAADLEELAEAAEVAKALASVEASASDENQGDGARDKAAARPPRKPNAKRRAEAEDEAASIAVSRAARSA